MRRLAIPVYGKQAEAVASREFLTAFIGGRGCGKTVVGNVDIFSVASDGEPYLAVSPDSNVVRETTLPEALDLATRAGIYIRHVTSPVPKLWFKTRDGGEATTVFRSGEKPDKLRGGSYAGAWIDEATVVSEEAFNLVIPTLRFRGKVGRILLTGTPKGTHHWTFKRLFTPARRDLLDHYADGAVQWIAGNPYLPRSRTKLIHATSRDNPFLGPEFYANIRGNYTSMLAEQELEGMFVEMSGMMFRREWFRGVDRVPRRGLRVRYIDAAATPAAVNPQASYTALVLMVLTQDGRFIVEDVQRGQWSAAERDRIIGQVLDADYRKYDGEVLTYREQEGGSGGKEAIEQWIKQFAGYSVFADQVSGQKSRSEGGETLPGQGKISRAQPLAAAAENGLVYYLRADWNQDWLNELAAFPNYAFADQVDASSGAFNKLNRNDFDGSGLTIGTKNPYGATRGSAVDASAASDVIRNLLQKQGIEL